MATRPSSPLVCCRLAAGYTQESFAEKLGVDRSTVCRWERRAMPSTLAAHDIAQLSSQIRLPGQDWGQARRPGHDRTRDLGYSPRLRMDLSSLGGLIRRHLPPHQLQRLVQEEAEHPED